MSIICWYRSLGSSARSEGCRLLALYECWGRVKASSLEVLCNSEMAQTILRTDVVVTSTLDSALPSLQRPALMGALQTASLTHQMICSPVFPLWCQKSQWKSCSFFVCLQQEIYILRLYQTMCFLFEYCPWLQTACSCFWETVSIMGAFGHSAEPDFWLLIFLTSFSKSWFVICF